MFIFINSIVSELPTAFSTETCCTGLSPGSNRLHHTAQVCGGLDRGVCVSALYGVGIMTKPSAEANVLLRSP